MTNPAYPAQHENYVHRGADNAFIDSIRELKHETAVTSERQ
jgi:hypothetical protein